MSFPASFEPHVAAIMEALVKTAVAEINKLMSDGTSVLRMEISRRDSEIQELKASLKTMEGELCKVQQSVVRRGETQGILVQTAEHQSDMKDEADDQEMFADYVSPQNDAFDPQGETLQNCDMKLVVKCEPLDQHETTSTNPTAAWPFFPLEALKPEDSLWSPFGRGGLLEKKYVEMENQTLHPSHTFPSDDARYPHRHTESTSDPVLVPVEVLPVDGTSTVSSQAERVGDASQPALAAEQASEFLSQQNSEKQLISRSDSRAKTPRRIYQKEHTCSICDRSFHRAFELKSHKITHESVKPFKCKCGKSFKHKNRFNSHQRVHTGEKPFSCKICSMQFSRKDNCLRHQRFHSGLKPHSCGVCGKSFTMSFHLRRHQELHLRT